MKEHFTIKEAAELLGIEDTTVRTYVSNGTIKSKKVYNSRVIERHELIDQLRKRGAKIDVRELERI